MQTRAIKPTKEHGKLQQTRQSAELSDTPSSVAIQRTQGCVCGGSCPNCNQREQSPVLNGRSSNKSDVQQNASSGGIGPQLGSLIQNAAASSKLNQEQKKNLNGISGKTLDKIRIHDNPAAHQAARSMRAHAFTIGPSIYLGKGVNQFDTLFGRHVLTHEAVHAHQQSDAAVPSFAQLNITPSQSRQEREANTFSRNTTPNFHARTLNSHAKTPIASVMRLSFEAYPETPGSVDISERIFPGGDNFSFGGLGGPEWKRGDRILPAVPFLFSWKGDAVIHGTEGEDFSNWEIGMIQRLHRYSLHFYWENGGKVIHCGDDYSNLKDAKFMEYVWFDNNDKSEPFGADGDRRSTKIEDSPIVPSIPYQHPSGIGKTGRFKFFAHFITYLSAHHIPGGFEPSAFQHLKSVQWKLTLEGTFDGNGLIGQVNAEGGTEVEDVIDASNETIQPILGGRIALDAINELPKCWQK